MSKASGGHTTRGGEARSEEVRYYLVPGSNLRIDAISPNSVSKNQAHTFTLTGTGFVSNFMAKLINENSQEFDIAQKEFVSATIIRVTAFIASGPTGTHKIKVIQGSENAEISFTALTEASLSITSMRCRPKRIASIRNLQAVVRANS